LQADVIDSIKEKVFELEIDSAVLPVFKEKHLVVNAIRKKDKVLVRYIADEQINGAVHSPASLEDAYLFLTKK
jgi:ABC-2 type transport system ATP-binding protein